MTELPSPKTRPASNWSAIWVLPLIALLIGVWLAWQAYSQAGVKIDVFFETGEGIQVGRTEVIYKGMSIGKVVDMRLDDRGERRGVHATLEMNQDFRDNLRDNTRFWLVKPSVSLAGITGLETLVSGNYIAVAPGDGEPSESFVALNEPPPISHNQPGLHLTLKAERLGSLNRDSPVFYRQIQVGRVKSYELGDDQTTVQVHIFIEPNYANLVRKHTRFWNASGISVDASLSGVKVRSESLSSLVSGGIAFATPEHRKDSPPTDPNLPFRLYEDFDSAQAGIKVSIELKEFEGVEAGRTPVMYKGIQVGLVKALQVKPDLSAATAEVTMDPLAEDYLVQGSEFWVVKPSISLAGISGLEALVKGNYLGMRPGDAGQPPQRAFIARAKAPPLDLRAPGLHLVLFADSVGSLEVGSPVLYRQVKVGSVQSYQLRRDNQGVVFGVHIEPEYAGLVNDSSRFWNASGITLSGGLSGIEVRSESLQTLLAGGISFETPDMQAGAPERKVPRFDLYADRAAAFQEGQPIRIRVESGDGLKAGTPIRYRGLEVGRVDAVTLSADLQGVVLDARVTSNVERIAARGAQFWVVRPELGLVRTANLDTLVSGPYVEVLPAGSNMPQQLSFTALPQAPGSSAREEGLRLVLSAPRRGSIKVGVPVTFREVPVGRVTGFELGPNADRVLIDILIEPRYSALVRSGSRFWNTSGFGFDFGLIKGATLRTESLETLIEGGIAFATPEGEQMGSQALPGQTFPMFAEAREEWLLWAPKIAIENQ